MQIIPIMTCFDNNYALPAAPCFYSLLANADKSYQYKIYVLHTDISEENQKLLHETISPFPNSSLEFINMEGKYQELFDGITNKLHFTKEMLYKFLPARMFPQYDKIIVTDVDVVFPGDIAPSYFAINANDDYYMAGIRTTCRKGSYQHDDIKYAHKTYSISHIYWAGYIVYNLKKMREDNLEEKLVHFVTPNAKKAKFMEQDALNVVCQPKIKDLPLNNLICSFHYDLYADGRFEEDLEYSPQEIKDAMDKPIQLHYAWIPKPWNDMFCLKFEEWWKYFVKTPYLQQWIDNNFIKQLMAKKKKEQINSNNMELGTLRKKVRLARNLFFASSICMIFFAGLSVISLLLLKGR